MFKKIFTLIELLVVIAIIGILMTILLPALKKAKDQSKNIACKNFLKQVGVVVQMYTQENDDYITGCNKIGTPSDQRGLGYNQWHHEDMLGAELPRATRSGYSQYAAPCPAMDSMGTAGKSYSWPIYCHLQYSGVISDGSIDPIKLNYIKFPSRKWTVTDGTSFYLSKHVINNNGTTPYSDSSGTTAARHNGFFNAVHYDGHTDSYNKSGSGNTTYERMSDPGDPLL